MAIDGMEYALSIIDKVKDKFAAHKGFDLMGLKDSDRAEGIIPGPPDDWDPGPVVAGFVAACEDLFAVWCYAVKNERGPGLFVQFRCNQDRHVSIFGKPFRPVGQANLYLELDREAYSWYWDKKAVLKISDMIAKYAFDGFKEAKRLVKAGLYNRKAVRGVSDAKE
jgi:hypothetical protein